MTTRLDQIQTEALTELCRRRHISKLALFASVLRPEFRPGSDIDVLVEFEAELSQLLGRRVDLNTPHFLSPRIRARVQAEAEVLVGPRRR